MPSGLSSNQELVLRNMLQEPGALSHWGEAMLTSQENPLVIGPSSLVSLGLTARSEDPADPVLHVSQDGREAMQATANRVVEVIFELVRNLCAPTAPSRLQALCAYDTVAQAEDFITDRRKGPHDIWFLDVPDDAPVHRGDGDWLGIYSSPLDFIGAAISYWNGAKTNTSVPHDHEVLVPLEVATVKSRVRTVG